MVSEPALPFAARIASRKLQWVSSQIPETTSSAEFTVKVVGPAPAMESGTSANAQANSAIVPGFDVGRRDIGVKKFGAVGTHHLHGPY
jgi:hypothetical protein